MTAIIIEVVLFLALVGVGVTLVVFVVRHFTPAGARLEQTRNRKQIERVVDLTCATHGPHDEREMVRLPSGELMCPQCYREVIGGT